MRWERKAAITRICANMPYGDKVYKFGQRYVGQLRAKPMGRLSTQVEMARWLAGHGIPIVKGKFLEVGTGHIPMVPIGFYLAGADRVITVDLNRRIDWQLTQESLEWMAFNRAEVSTLYGEDIVPRDIFEERFARLVESTSDPQRFLDQAGIEYLAPGDAGSTRLAVESVDCHFSVTVLEHIPEGNLREIFIEAKRILRVDGVALHFIDPSDHFEHQDKTITPINFLKYSDDEWQRLAGNQFAYCNRLRASDFLKMFSNLGFITVRSETTIDERSTNILQQGFVVDKRFRDYGLNDLCSTALRIMLKK